MDIRELFSPVNHQNPGSSGLLVIFERNPEAGKRVGPPTMDEEIRGFLKIGRPESPE